MREPEYREVIKKVREDKICLALGLDPDAEHRIGDA